jgi:hypothetical protein
MKSIYTLAATLLVFPESVVTDDNIRKGVTDLGLQAMNLSQVPYGLLNAQTAFHLIDKLCGQNGDGIHTGTSTVSGAFNVDTGQFMAWHDYVPYVKTVLGQNLNYDDYLAMGGWNTFYGECSLQPQSTWWERSYMSTGGWATNFQNNPSVRKVLVDVRFEGFAATCTMASWHAKCNNVDTIADEFRRIVPEDMKTAWTGLDRRYEQTIRMRRSVYLYPEQRARVVATTVVRVVHAVQVFRVSNWYWHYEDGAHGSASSWLGLGPEWEQVYADLAFVEGRGICQQGPSVGRVHSTGQADPCVNMDYVEYDPPLRQPPRRQEL